MARCGSRGSPKWCASCGGYREHEAERVDARGTYATERARTAPLICPRSLRAWRSIGFAPSSFEFAPSSLLAEGARRRAQDGVGERDTGPSVPPNAVWLHTPPGPESLTRFTLSVVGATRSVAQGANALVIGEAVEERIALCGAVRAVAAAVQHASEAARAAGAIDPSAPAVAAILTGLALAIGVDATAGAGLARPARTTAIGARLVAVALIVAAARAHSLDAAVAAAVAIAGAGIPPPQRAHPRSSPPQSMSVSLPPSSPSAHGSGRHAPARHRWLAHCASAPQAWPSGHAPQAASPQSTTGSSPLTTPSSQRASAHAPSPPQTPLPQSEPWRQLAPTAHGCTGRRNPRRIRPGSSGHCRTSRAGSGQRRNGATRSPRLSSKLRAGARGRSR